MNEAADTETTRSQVEESVVFADEANESAEQAYETHPGDVEGHGATDSEHEAEMEDDSESSPQSTGCAQALPREVIDANAAYRVAERRLEEAKSERAAATARFKACQEAFNKASRELSEVIDGHAREPLPPFSGQMIVNGTQPADETADLADLENPEKWRSWPLSVLTSIGGLSASIVSKIAGGIDGDTLGEFATWQDAKPDRKLTELKGIGQESAKKIEDAFIPVWGHRDWLIRALSEPETEPASSGAKAPATIDMLKGVKDAVRDTSLDAVFTDENDPEQILLDAMVASEIETVGDLIGAMLSDELALPEIVGLSPRQCDNAESLFLGWLKARL
jgi:hypothetical protein